MKTYAVTYTTLRGKTEYRMFVSGRSSSEARTAALLQRRGIRILHIEAA